MGKIGEIHFETWNNLEIWQNVGNSSREIIHKPEFMGFFKLDTLDLSKGNIGFRILIGKSHAQDSW